jgi:hypothetical protein
MAADCVLGRFVTFDEATDYSIGFPNSSAHFPHLTDFITHLTRKVTWEGATFAQVKRQSLKLFLVRDRDHAENPNQE